MIADQQLFRTIAAMKMEGCNIYAHSVRVAGYSAAIAQKLQLSPPEISIIERAALLHDIGKISVARSVLIKPGHLTAKEYDQVKQHSIVGERVANRIRGLAPLAPLIRSHHERYDGYGYPDGLRAKNIPIGGRIIAVADAFDAMTTVRPYRSARSIKASVDELLVCSGTQFDPQVVKAFLASLEKERFPKNMLSRATRKLFEQLCLWPGMSEFVYQSWL